MFECHVTIEPVLSELGLATLKEIAERHGFRVANLLMHVRDKDTLERSKHDTFMTAHHLDFWPLHRQMVALAKEVQEAGFTVWRYKIELIMLDSKYEGDSLNLLKGAISLCSP